MVAVAVIRGHGGRFASRRHAAPHVARLSSEQRLVPVSGAVVSLCIVVADVVSYCLFGVKPSF